MRPRNNQQHPLQTSKSVFEFISSSSCFKLVVLVQTRILQVPKFKVTEFSCILSCFLSVLVFNVWLLKSEMEKNKKRGWPFKFPESHFSQRKTGLQQDGVEEEGGIMAAFLFVCISVIRSRYQQSQHRFPVFRG